ncbi:MAG: amine dehydrogenase [Chromatiales bacterium]|nr:amine dehydrogenase [Chromatiales bacterium]
MCVVRRLILIMLLSCSPLCLAQGLADRMTIATLPPEYQPHWVWVNDIAYGHVADGQAFLVDADTGRFLATLSAGGFFMKLELPSTRNEIYAAATFYPRVNRGERTDVVTIFDPQTLSPVDEVIIPPRRQTGNPTLAHSALTDEQRFMAIYNMTPAQSVSVVDMQERKFVEEIATPGCALIYPTGIRRFQMLCGDGSLLTVSLNEDGSGAGQVRSKPFFDPWQDPVTEKAVRINNQWLYVSFDGYVYPVDVAGKEPKFLPTWSLLSAEDRAESWRIGGLQHLAVHERRQLLFSLMHKGGIDSHKDPGNYVWVYDLRSKKRINRIKLKGAASAIQVTQDDQPLLLTAFIGNPKLTVYDPDSGERLRTIKQLGSTITGLQTN